MPSYIPAPRPKSAKIRLEELRKQFATSGMRHGKFATWRGFHDNPWTVMSRTLGWETHNPERRSGFFNDTPYVYAFTNLSIFNGEVRDTGFRFTGWSDELVGSINHTGWYMDNEQGDFQGSARGFVLQMPATKNGVKRCFPALYQSENSEILMWPREVYDDEKDAARAADELARMWAEESCDWYEKDQKERRIEDMKEEICDEKKAVKEFRLKRRQLVSAIKQVSTVYPTGSVVLTVLKEQLKQARDDSRASHLKIEELERKIENES
ncbi:hypothetical protein PJWF_00084 [Achromobacter phage JWF]|uniref:hypothetical protein n=1 Tax=Achromobacter phage JWF TaxID=1589748 RepID=UPI000588E699|nr:hypothetical protein AXJ13_gp104 [Achromobacter phage JWF]AJD82977.1 hypothetical protein PJWF_00084 [Achromobacter phage JWF]